MRRSVTRRSLFRVLSLVLLVATIVAGWKLLVAWQYQSALDSVAIFQGHARFESARDVLLSLQARYPSSEEVAFHLGNSEHALNHPEAALAAWSRLRLGGPFAALATVARADNEGDRGEGPNSIGPSYPYPVASIHHPEFHHEPKTNGTGTMKSRCRLRSW